MTAATRLLFALLLALAVTGCATLAPGDAGQMLPGEFPDYDNWQFRGRVSLTRGEEGWHAGVSWQEDAGALVADVTGWQFPVSGIRYWVRRLPAPAPQSAAVISRDESGLLQRLEQSGWDIEYSRFEYIDGWNWPKKLRLRNGELVVRLVIDHWVLPVPEDGGGASQPAASAGP